MGVGYDYMGLCFDFIGGGLGACSALVVSLINNLTGGLGKPSLHPVQGPFGILTVSECCPEMLHFFLGEAQVYCKLFFPYE